MLSAPSPHRTQQPNSGQRESQQSCSPRTSCKGWKQAAQAQEKPLWREGRQGRVSSTEEFKELSNTLLSSALQALPAHLSSALARAGEGGLCSAVKSHSSPGILSRGYRVPTWLWKGFQTCSGRALVRVNRCWCRTLRICSTCFPWQTCPAVQKACSSPALACKCRCVSSGWSEEQLVCASVASWNAVAEAFRVS